MKSISILAILSVVLVCNVVSDDEECDVIPELYKFVSKGIVMFVPDKADQEILTGCVYSLFYGDPDRCNMTNFKLTEAKRCKEVINSTDFKKEIKKHNLNKIYMDLERQINNNGGDIKLICEKMPTEGDKILNSLKKTQNECRKIAYEICKGNIDKCDKIQNTWKEIESIVDRDRDIKPFIKILKMMMMTKSNITALFFGGNDFGVKAGECLKEILFIAIPISH